MEYIVNKTKIKLVHGDITLQDVDAIVNAANSSLLGGGGVDGAIHEKAGPNLRKECALIRKNKWPDGLPRGKAVITKGYDLKARYVIHTVGPIYPVGPMYQGTGNEPELLKDCYKNTLMLAIENGLRTIAYPAISTGAYNYPIWEATEIALKTTKGILEKFDNLGVVIFVCYRLKDIDVYKKVAKKIFD
jgi:O-acetyl-ADP-ribose deacetylase (regulator of RNase III)